MQEARKFKPKTIAYRLVALGVGALLSLSANKEPSQSKPIDSGSFFIVSNPGSPSIGQTLKNKIQEAQNRLDLQIYALSDKGLIKAINQKAKTTPTFIYYDPSASKDLKEKIDTKVSLVPYSHKGLMHRKITVIDKTTCLIGSANYTSSSLFWHYNNLCVIKSEKLAEFLNAQKRGSCQFEYGKAYLLPDYKNYALMHLISKVESAKSSIHLAMFSLTHKKILESLKSAALRGVKIYLYIDRANFKNLPSGLEELMTKCEKIYTQNKPVLMHHKLCLIDDMVMITGSSNWSVSGFKKNEEVLLIFDKLLESDLKSCKEIFLKLQDELELYPYSNKTKDNYIP